MQSLRRLAFAGGTIGVVWASPAAADDWATPITAVQKNLADAGVNLGFGVTEFGQGLPRWRSGSSGARQRTCP